MTVSPTILYRPKCGATKKQKEEKLHIVEMCVLGRMCGVTKNDIIRSEHIR